MTATTGEVPRVADEILRRIVSGAYPAGLRLPAETELAAEFEVSRATLREALRHLASLGVVVTRRGSGAYVRDFRREGTLALLPAYAAFGRFDRPLGTMVRELLRIRRLLAVEAVRLAALYATPETIAKVRRFIPILGDCRDALKLANAELEMFRELTHASEIWPAAWLANAFWGPMRELHERLAPLVGIVPENYGATLERVFELVEKHDAEGAMAVLGAHFDEIDKALATKLDELLPKAWDRGGV